MDSQYDWLKAPAQAFRFWQETDATGSTRRPFSARSIVQHAVMFDRFIRHLSRVEVTLATFGPEHIESFFRELEDRCAPGTSTPLRYAKLLDRVCRHLVEIGVRIENPATARVREGAWPADDPVPLFLDEVADLQLQDLVIRRRPAK